MTDKGIYIYGVIDNGSCAAGPPGLASHGIHTVPYKDISAVVADSVVIDRGKLPGDVAVRRLIEHQVVMERLMKDFTVIPARPGTYVLGEDEVMLALTKGYHVFKEVLAKIEGRIELDVVAAWADLHAVIREVSEEEEVKAVKQALFTKKEGITVDDQMKAGTVIKSCLDRKKQEYALTMKNSLENLCRNIKEYTVLNDVTIMNAAFFIDKSGRTRFEERLDELSGSFGGKVHFKCVGPLPPYNFYMLDITQLQYDDVERAREKLALSAFTTKDEIKRAYRKSASMYHPDKQFDTQSHAQKAKANTEYGEITKAYGLLSTYCQDGACSFKKEEFAGKSIIVVVREQ
jgi:DnaJ-domain-containing protein 1